MKTIISTFLLVSMLALAPVMPSTAVAATNPVGLEAEFADFDDAELAELFELGESSELAEFKPCPAGTFRVRRNTRTKKKLVNSLIAGGIGAAVGGGIGGGRGALIGLGSGAGGYLVYRYVRDRRGRCVARYVRRG